MRRLATLSLVLALLPVLAGCPALDTILPGDQTTQDDFNILYQVAADNGTFRVDGTGVTYALTLNAPANEAFYFTDSPTRLVGNTLLQTLTYVWANAGFTATPSRAALVLADEPRDRDVIIVELTNPAYDITTGRFTATARIVDGPTTGWLAVFTQQANTSIPDTFDTATLFLDTRGDAPLTNLAAQSLLGNFGVARTAVSDPLVEIENRNKEILGLLADKADLSADLAAATDSTTIDALNAEIAAVDDDIAAALAAQNTALAALLGELALTTTDETVLNQLLPNLTPAN